MFLPNRNANEQSRIRGYRDNARFLYNLTSSSVLKIQEYPAKQTDQLITNRLQMSIEQKTMDLPSCSNGGLLTLPQELQLQIFNNLSITELARLREACPQLKSVIETYKVKQDSISLKEFKNYSKWHHFVSLERAIAIQGRNSHYRDKIIFDGLKELLRKCGQNVMFLKLTKVFFYSHRLKECLSNQIKEVDFCECSTGEMELQDLIPLVLEHPLAFKVTFNDCNVLYEFSGKKPFNRFLLQKFVHTYSWKLSRLPHQQRSEKRFLLHTTDLKKKIPNVMTKGKALECGAWCSTISLQKNDEAGLLEIRMSR
jgi:hypothetical protein